MLNYNFVLTVGFLTQFNLDIDAKIDSGARIYQFIEN